MNHIRVEQIVVEDAITDIIRVPHVEKSNHAAIIEDGDVLVNLIDQDHCLHVVAWEDAEEKDLRRGEATSQLVHDSGNASGDVELRIAPNVVRP